MIPTMVITMTGETENAKRIDEFLNGKRSDQREHSDDHRVNENRRTNGAFLLQKLPESFKVFTQEWNGLAHIRTKICPRSLYHRRWKTVPAPTHQWPIRTALRPFWYAAIALIHPSAACKTLRSRRFTNSNVVRTKFEPCAFTLFQSLGQLQRPFCRFDTIMCSHNG